MGAGSGAAREEFRGISGTSKMKTSSKMKTISKMKTTSKIKTTLIMKMI